MSIPIPSPCRRCSRCRRCSEEPTAWAGGKAKVLGLLKKRYGGAPLVMVGDGMTDVEARQDGCADAVIGFGGVVVRQPVKDAADVFVMDFQEMIDQL